MKERLSNDTVVEIDRLTGQELISLIEDRVVKLQAIQHDIDRFVEEITARYQAVSPECGE